ncbi:hypothetical protein DFR70_101754 [Nocardia tenerifensis]|uniref:Uncharacterized protein n=1 Tax=Nocardia tenerifensis TaxID=228006 RepID=A0A318KGE5_9NOCA|nr:hypothetical protein [Nocardia tenerifensis]PXX71332.1 hypothetical protein DFR70_101754 [Nocardia tenerifensis]
MNIDARDHPADDPLDLDPAALEPTDPADHGPEAAHMLRVESDPPEPSGLWSTETTTDTHRMTLAEARDADAEPAEHPEADLAERVLANQPRGPDGTAEPPDPPETSAAAGETRPAAGEYEGTSKSGEIEQRRTAAVDAACARHGVDSDEGRAAVEKAYEVVFEYQAPFVVRHTLDIIEDCKADIAAKPDAVVAYVGRDGHPIALAALKLDPELFESHSTEVTVSRRLADAAVQDLEINAGKTFEAIEGFRSARHEVDRGDIDGAKAQLTRYLEGKDLPVGLPGSTIILVDSSFKGTVQELLSATYPDVEFRGRYLIFGESPNDPHPGSKAGYALHQSVDRAAPDLDADPAAIFTEKDAVLAIEHILRGPYSKAVRFGPDRQPAQELESPPLDQINPLDVAPSYADANVRLAVMEANQLAVGDYAEHIAGLRRGGGDWHNELATKSETFLRQVRSWVTRNSDTDPAFAELCDSFVRRTDKTHVGDLRTAIEHRGLGEDDATQVWRDYRQLGSLDEKQAFVADFHRRTDPSTGV